MAEQKQDQQQTTVRTPGPYPEGGGAIWQEFLDRFFGTPHVSEEQWGAMDKKPNAAGTYEEYLETPELPGLLNLAQNANQFGADQWDQFYNDTLLPAYGEHGDVLDKAMHAGNAYQKSMQVPTRRMKAAIDVARQNPYAVNFGGQTMRVVPRGGINLEKDRFDTVQDNSLRRLAFDAGLLPALSQERMGNQITPAQMNMQQQIASNPDMISANYITDNLLPLATGIQGMRYGIPTQMSSGSGSTDTELGWPGILGLGGNILGNLGVDFGDLWGGLESAGGFLGDLFGGLFNGGGDDGSSGGITWA